MESELWKSHQFPSLLFSCMMVVNAQWAYQQNTRGSRRSWDIQLVKIICELFVLHNKIGNWSEEEDTKVHDMKLMKCRLTRVMITHCILKRQRKKKKNHKQSFVSLCKRQALCCAVTHGLTVHLRDVNADSLLARHAIETAHRHSAF